ncbi:MAG: cell division protein FtsQ/DivIB [Bacteroidales bacterium]|nr:cell division protein FtsQ/DivIB [Bacteroidales bacterium]
MKARVRHLITLAFVLMFVLIVALIASIGNSSRSMLTCGGIDVKFADSLEFVNEEDVRMCVERLYGSYIGQRLDSMGLARIEGILEEQSAIKTCEAWTTDDGLLHLLISRRQPLARFTKDGQSVYADDRGDLFPLQNGFIAHVPEITGVIPTDKEWVQQVTAMLDYMQSHYWDKRISSIRATDGGEIILTSAEGGEKILFGTPTDVEQKFWRLAKYYSHILPYKGDGYYRKINVKYNKQIICSRTDI